MTYDVCEAEDILSCFDKENIETHKLDYVNWENYPYKPQVSFRIAYTSDSILLHYNVNEKSARAKYDEDNESVWTDSCVEFFCIPSGDGVYYNIECNCIGTILIGAGKDRKGRERATREITGCVKRYSSLGDKAFDLKIGDFNWSVSLIIPFTAFFKHKIDSLDGKTIKANFYKCGDELLEPHFISWNPIELKTPNFHCPEYFGSLEF